MLVILCVYFYKVIGNKNKHISAVVSTLNAKETERKNINALNARMIELGDMNKRIGGYLVSTSEADRFVEYLEDMGVSNNTTLSVKSVEIPKNEKNKIALMIEMKGSFENITKIIALIENAPYNISINSLYLNKEILVDTEVNNTQGKIKEIIVPTKSLWQASLSFTVVSL